MVFYGFHGVYDEERRLGQRFIVTLHLFTDEQNDPDIYKLEDTVDYTKVFEVIKNVMENEQFQLLEACANRILDRVLTVFTLVTKVKVYIQKPSVAIQGSLKSVEIVMQRSRI
jgi:dihydroneopterin aldolase